jgi:hypothetical protein
MLRCREVTRLHASDGVHHASWGKRIAVRLHLLMCRACQRYVQELHSIGEATRDAARDIPADPDRVEAIVQRVLEEGTNLDPEA